MLRGRSPRGWSLSRRRPCTPWRRRVTGSAAHPSYSIVIPVYGSVSLVGRTIDRTVAFCVDHDLDYELVLVNDGSIDGSWDVIAAAAETNPRVIAVDLLRNYGQHTAVLAGMRIATGDYVITMDDDLQNPPEEIGRLIERAGEGYDLVIGQFTERHHPRYRQLGTMMVGWMNRRIFGKPKDLALTNFRCIRRDVVDRMTAHRTFAPYIPGLALMYSAARTNVWVDHQAREGGGSSYSFWKLLALVFRITFNYSSLPLRVVSAVGLFVTVLSFALGAFWLLRATFVGIRVPGFASLALMLALFNGVALLILSMLGEYTVRLLNQMSAADAYHVRETVRHVD